MNKLEKLKAIYSVMKEDTITPANLKEIVSILTKVVKESKDTNEKVSSEIKQALKDVVSYLSKEQDKLVLKVSGETDEKISKTEKRITEVLSKAEKALEEISKIEVKDGYIPVKGVDYFDGENGSPDTGEEIIKKINDDDTSKIKQEKIEGVEKFTTQGDIDRAISILDQRSQFLINKTVKHDSTLTGNGTDASPLSVVGGTGSSTFIDLTDTPSSYTGENGKFVRVNATSDGLEFATISGGGDFMADGSIPMTGDLNMGGNDITDLVSIQADGSGGLSLKGSGGDTCLNLGAGGGCNATFYDGVKLDALTASKLLFLDGNKNISTTGIGTSSQFLKGDGSLDSSTYLTSSNIIPSSNVSILGIGTPTYTTLANWEDIQLSSGRISGLTITAHSPADGTIDVSSGTGMIKIANTLTGAIKFFDFAGVQSIALTDNALNYIYVDYNAGTPRILATTDRSAIHDYDQFTIGRVYREGTEADITSSGTNIYNEYRRVHNRLVKKYGFDWASGSTVSESNVRKLAVTAGVWYVGNTEIDTSALDTNVSGSFSTYYTSDSGSTWTKDTGVTQLGNTQYNDVTAGLATMIANKYANYWVYQCPQGSLYVVYGQAQYNSLAEAQGISGPTLVPPYLTGNAKLIARITFLKSATNFASVTSLRNTTIATIMSTLHNNLGNLGWTSSGHTGTASNVAGFDGTGVASYYAIDTDLSSTSGSDDTVPSAKATKALGDLKVNLSQSTPQTIGDTSNRLAKLWATDITCTNAITGSVTGNAGTVTNATLTTALTVNTGTVTLTGNVANTSALTIGAGAVSVSGTNTGDQTNIQAISDTKANFNTALSDGNFMFVGDAPTAHTHEGTAILSTGETGGTKFLREDGDGTCSWQTITAGGNVSKVGTPVDNQIGVWTGDGTIEGTTDFTYNSTDSLITLGKAVATGKFSLLKGKLAFADQAPVAVTGSERVQFEDADGANSDWSFRIAGNGAGTINFASSGGTLGTPTDAGATAILGAMTFKGYVTNAYVNKSWIEGLNDGTIKLIKGVNYNDVGAILNMTNIATTSKTFSFPNATGTLALGTGTANQIAYWSDANTLGALAVATYPSLTELAYVKGVTSGIQTQLNAKGVGDMLLGTAQSVTETKTFTKDKLLIKGTSTGTTNLTTANTSSTSYTATLPAKDGTIAMTSDIVSQVEDSVTDGHTTIAPSGNAVFDALALKAPLSAPVFTSSTKVINSGDHASDYTPTFLTNHSRGSISSPTAILNGDLLSAVEMGGHDGTNWTDGWNGGAGFVAQATENWTTSAHGTKFIFRTTKNGTTGWDDRFTVENNGSIYQNGDLYQTQTNSRYFPQFVMLNGYNGADGSYFITCKARGSITSPTSVQDGDYLGTYMFKGYNTGAGDYVNSASMTVMVDGTVTGNYPPSKLLLSTSDTSGSLNQVGLTIFSTGKLLNDKGATLAAINYAADAQSNDTYVITLNPAPAAYTTGMQVIFKAKTANTGAATLNVNGLGAKTIVKAVSTTLANNDILANMFCLVVYDGTNFVLMNPRAL